MSELIPVNVLTGFLGSGKTTLLNRMLLDPGFADSAVLINEYGAVGIDHHLVQSIEGDVVLLKSGCVCCTIRGEVSTAMREVLDQRERGRVPPFVRVVFETTGLADPVPVVSTVMNDRVLRHHFRVGNVLTTIDGLNGGRNLDQFPECLKQVALADRLVLTKLDLASHEHVQELLIRLRQANPLAPVVRANTQQLDALMLLGEDAFSLKTKGVEVERWLQGARQPQYLTVRPHAAEAKPAGAHGEIDAVTLTLPQAINWTVFSVWLSLLLHAHGDRVLRVKGLLNVDGADTPVVIQGVQQMVYPPTHLERWPDEDRRSRIVFIVQGLEAGAIEASLTAYLTAYSG